MPFTRLNPLWNVVMISSKALEQEVRSYHYKAWISSKDGSLGELHRLWKYQIQEMEQYYADVGLQGRHSGLV